MALATYPQITFRNMRQTMSPQLGSADHTDYAAAHPFAPAGWGPQADPASLDPAAPAMTEHGLANARANAGVYDPGTHGAANAVANGTGVVAPRFVDPVGGPGIRSNPAYPVAPDPVYRAVNGVGTPGAAAPVAPGSPTLRQGQVAPVAPGRFDLRGAGAAAGAPTFARDPEAMAMGAVFPSSGLPPVAPIGAGGAEFDRMMPLLSAAAGLDDAQAGDQANRNLAMLKRAGALPVAGEAPEISANKFGYLRSRLDASLAGGAPRAPGSPVYPGASPVAPGATALAAGAYRNLQSTSRQPQLVDFAPGVRGLVDRQGNVSRVPEDQNAPREHVIGGRKLTAVGDKFFDDQGQPVRFGADTPPRAPDVMLKTLDPELYQSQREEYLAYTQAKKGNAQPAATGAASAGGPAAGAAPALSSQDQQALAWAKANPKDPRAARINQRLGAK